MVNTKESTYEPLVALANDLYKRGLRTQSPIFFPSVISHEGEFSSKMIQLIEIMTIRGYKPYASKLKKDLPDGDPISFKTAQYRTSFKDALICQCVSGLGSSLLAAGKPSETWTLKEATNAPSYIVDESHQHDINELAQGIAQNLPSESPRKSRAGSPTRPPMRRLTTQAELTMRRTTSAPARQTQSTPPIPGFTPTPTRASSSCSSRRGCGVYSPPIQLF